MVVAQELRHVTGHARRVLQYWMRLSSYSMRQTAGRSGWGQTQTLTAKKRIVMAED